MKTTAVTPADLARSVLAVAPLARAADLRVSDAENRRLVAHLLAGGVTTLLYGGNANLYNAGVGDFAELLDALEGWAAEETWMIPSIGADYGKALDQARILKERSFPTAMLLPLGFPATPVGVATGLRRLADAAGLPLIAYVKSDGFITAGDAGRLKDDGVICAVKYAVVRSDPADDPYLQELVAAVGPEHIVSGIGERPAVAHLSRFRLQGFTSGSVCIAPRLSMELLRALQAGEWPSAEAIREVFLPLEDVRDRHSPIRTLHEAVRLAGICDTGPMAPFLSNLADPEVLEAVEEAARALRDADETFARATAAG